MKQPDISADTSSWTTLWAMDKATLQNAYAQSNKAQVNSKPAQPTKYAVNGTTAIIPIVGCISKYPTILGALSGEVATLGVQASIETALYDDAVESIVLFIDTPGGAVAGTSDLAQYIQTAKALKPITAFCSDRCLSAGYWIASACTSIIANEGAFIGSIGVYAVLMDTSEAAQQAGVQVRLVASGEYKGLDTDGIPVTDKAIGETQRNVDAACGLFIKSISEGRNLPIETVKQLADGRMHIAGEAIGLNLIDAIGTLDFALSEGTNMDNKKAQAAAPVQDAPTDAKDSDVSAILKQIQDTLAKLVEAVSSITDSDDADDATGDPSNADDDADAKANKAVAQDRDRLKAISEACGANRADFALKSFLEGKSAVEAKASLADVLNTENTELHKKVAKGANGIEPLALSGGATVDPNDPEQLWAKNVDDVQTKFSGRKDYFLNTLKHTKNKGSK